MTSLYQDLCRTVMQYCCEYNYVIFTHLVLDYVVMMSRVHLYMYGMQRRPTSHTAISIEHASAVVSMLNQMTDGSSIMQKPKTLLQCGKPS